MPGLAGIASRTPWPDLKSSLAQLTSRSERWRHETVVDPEGAWAVSRTHLGVLEPQSIRPDDTLHILLHGDIGGTELAPETAAPPGPERPSEVVRRAYCRLGPAFASRLDGSFTAVVVDSRARRLVIANDLLGSHPLYWTVHRGALIFGPELRAIRRMIGAGSTPNPAAVADCLTFGFLLGTKTLDDQIELLPPGAALEYRLDEGTARVERYGSVADLFNSWNGTRASYLEAVRHAFTRAVERALTGPHRFGLALSGGLDSRAILSAVDGHAAELTTCTLGAKGCADEVIAEKLAALAGTRHLFFELDARYLGEFLPDIRRMVTLTDGMYLSHGLTEMLAVDFLGRSGVEVLLRGHGGELAKTRLAWPLHTDNRVYETRTGDELATYLLERANYITAGIAWDELFTDDWYRRVKGRAEDSLRQVVAGVALSPPDLCAYLYLHEQHRRFTVSSLELFRQVVEVRLPFLDRRLLEVLFRGDARWRDDTNIHKALIATGQAAMLHVRDANTGAAPSAGPLSGRVLDKLNSVFRRLNVAGYRHYHSFDRWMRRELLASVEATLLDRRSLGRGIFREGFLRRLIEDTGRGRGDHAYLLQVLLILELWQREQE